MFSDTPSIHKTSLSTTTDKRSGTLSFLHFGPKMLTQDLPYAFIFTLQIRQKVFGGYKGLTDFRGVCIITEGFFVKWQLYERNPPLPSC